MTFVGSSLTLALLAIFVAYMARLDIFRFRKVSKLNVLPKEDDWMSIFHTAYEHPCWRSTTYEQPQQQQSTHLVSSSITYINPGRGRSISK